MGLFPAVRATVLVTHLNDPRLEAAARSALDQGALAQQVLVADGGSRTEVLEPVRRAFQQATRLRIVHLPGSVAETRNAALPLIKTDLTVFLDADQVAPPGWLQRLLQPILDGAADFTGGPTRHHEEASRAERYVNREEDRLYAEGVAQDIALLPMGNSAWRTDLLRKVGGFDPRLKWGGEDYDLNLRAVRAGARGRFVPEAWVWHDQSQLRSFRKVLRRKSRYYFGAATAYLKNDAMDSRARASIGRFRVRHPIDLLDVVLKPWALARAHRYYRRAFAASR
jgi:cellulose synthase/poly-beta-1,6-N-acetylglucosamine synthase-like glycosyltransferase